MTKLYSLISQKIIKKYQISNLLINGITCDSRKVKKGYIFAVFKGWPINVSLIPTPNAEMISVI